MALKIRMRQQGRNNRPFFRIVLANSRSPRDGKYIETLGWYNPFEEEQEKAMFIQADRVEHWLKSGAEISERVKILVTKMAPAVMNAYQEKQQTKRVKLAAKSRSVRKKRAAAKA